MTPVRRPWTGKEIKGDPCASASGLAAYAETLKAKGIRFEGPEKSHLGMLILKLEDPDGHLVEIQQFTEGTPAQVRKAFDP